MSQSDQYNDSDEVAYVANFPGADPENGWIVVKTEGPVPLKNKDGDKINPATEDTLGSILQAVATEDTLGDIAGALQSNGSDVVVVDQDSAFDVSAAVVTVDQDSPFDVSGETVPTEQQTPVALENTSDSQIDPATQQTLEAVAAALQSNDGDKLLVQHDNVIDISSRDDRNLGDVDVTAVDDTVETEDHDSGFLSGSSLNADASVSVTLSGQGSETIKGRVVSDSQYTVELSWTDGGGNEIFRDEVATDVAGGTGTDISQEAISPNVEVIVTDTSSSASTVNATAHLA